jgi:methyl-accepting chemotaxis protein
MRSGYNHLRETLAANTRDDKEQIASAFVSARQLQRTTILLMVGIGLASLGVLVALSRMIVGTLARSLSRAVEAAERLSRGDMTARIEVDSNDEIGQLQRATLTMTQSLSQVIADVRAAATTVAASAFQISASSQALSQGTSEQAASVEETTSSLEEMSASIGQNAENSRQTE